MKIFKFIGLCVLALSLIAGCSGKTLTQVVTGACTFVLPYMEQINKGFADIQKEYPKYEAIVTGKTNALASEVVMARAWIAAADKILVTFGAVVNNACRNVLTSDVQMALQLLNETLPKTSINPEKMKMLKVVK